MNIEQKNISVTPTVSERRFVNRSADDEKWAASLVSQNLISPRKTSFEGLPTRMCACVFVLLLCVLNIQLARCGPAEPEARDAATIDIAPTASAGQINAAKLRLPAADATSVIAVTEEAIGNSKKYTFRNTGSTEVFLWTFPLRRSMGGHIFIDGGALATLKPGESKKCSMLYTLDARGELYGEYRVVYCATETSRYYRNRPAGELSEEGEKVKDAVYKGFERRVEESKDKYVK